MATTETRRYRGYDIVPMIDIVERLRVRPLIANDDPDIVEWRKIMEEAADEIEQLRTENAFLEKGNVGVREAIADVEEEMTLEEISAEVQQLPNASDEERHQFLEQLRTENAFLEKGNVAVREAIADVEEEMTLEEITAEVQQLLNASDEERHQFLSPQPSTPRQRPLRHRWRRGTRRSRT